MSRGRGDELAKLDTLASLPAPVAFAVLMWSSRAAVASDVCSRAIVIWMASDREASTRSIADHLGINESTVRGWIGSWNENTMWAARMLEAAGVGVGQVVKAQHEST